MMDGLRRWSRQGLLLGLVLSLPDFASAQGLQLFGIGPVNRSMGGASTAAPIEAIGALHFNPATLTAHDNQLSVGSEVVSPLVDIDSSFMGRSGQTNSDSGWAAVPAIGLAFKPKPDGPMTIGFGLFGVAGYSVNYPASTTNPILFPQTPPPGSGLTPGVGNVFADVSLLQLAPSIAMKLSDQLSVAAGPTVMAGRLAVTPFPYTAPDDSNGDGVFTYPVVSGTRSAWALGFQVGVFWQGENCVNLGESYKSPQWFQDFEYHGTTERGLPRDFEFRFDYPQIVSLGASYTGIEKWLFATDVRYFDWRNTSDLPGEPAAFGANGAITGLGW
jgi:long-chain fatty acid transport protein